MINLFKRIKLQGTKVIIIMDEEMIAHDRVPLLGVIKEIRYDKNERPFLQIQLDNNLPNNCYESDELTNEILVGGLSMNVVKELFGIRRRPRGIPIIVEVRNVSKTIPIEELGEKDKKTFLGRGVIRLKNGKIPKDEFDEYRLSNYDE